MKKALFSMLLMILASTGASYAQKTNIAYHGEVNLGYSVGVGNLFSGNRINLHTIQGIKSGNLSTGIGIGCDLYHEGGVDAIIPIFWNLKGYLPVSQTVSPFISLDLGAGICANGGTKGYSGLYLTPAIGLQVKTYKFQLGYNIQQISVSGVSASLNALQILVGTTF